MSQSKAEHVCWSELPAEQLNPLFARQYVVGKEVMIARIAMKRGCLVPVHSHRHEQISHVLSGSLRFLIEGREILAGSGDLVLIPPHVPHSVDAVEDSVAVDLFAPRREDWISGDDAYLRGR